MSKTDIYGNLQMTAWLDEKDTPEGTNRIALEVFRELKDIDKRMARNNIIMFFLISRYGMDLWAQMTSTKKQREIVSAVKKKIKGDERRQIPGHAITAEWVPVFQRNIQSLRRRANRVFGSIKVNLEETELYPYFATVGFDRLVDFSAQYPEDKEAQAKQLQREIEEWNSEHREAIDNYMASIAERIANRDARKARIAEDEKAEKEARRLARKMANAEVKEIRANEKAHKKRDRKLGVAGDSYWR